MPPTIRGLVEDERARNGREALKPAHALAVLAREKPLKEELVARDARQDQGGHTRRGARNDLHGGSFAARELNKHLTGIGHARHARVRGERDALTGEHTLHELGGTLGDHVVIAAHKGF